MKIEPALEDSHLSQRIARLVETAQSNQEKETAWEANLVEKDRLQGLLEDCRSKLAALTQQLENLAHDEVVLLQNYNFDQQAQITSYHESVGVVEADFKAQSDPLKAAVAVATAAGNFGKLVELGAQLGQFQAQEQQQKAALKAEHQGKLDQLAADYQQKLEKLQAAVREAQAEKAVQEYGRLDFDGQTNRLLRLLSHQGQQLDEAYTKISQSVKGLAYYVQTHDAIRLEQQTGTTSAILGEL